MISLSMRNRAAGLILFTRIKIVRSCISVMRSVWRILLESLAMNKSGCVLLLVIVLSFGACGGGAPAPNNSSPTPPPPRPQFPPPLPVLEKALQYTRADNYTYVWFFSRKDQKPLDR